MSYKKKCGPIQSENYPVGENVDRVVYDIFIQGKKESEKEKIKDRVEDGKKRHEINAFILDRIAQGWPLDEIKIAAERQFAEYTPGRIEYLIKYWQEKYLRMIDYIDSILENVRSGKLTKTMADLKMGYIKRKYSGFKQYGFKYYEKGLNDIKQGER